MGMPPLHSAHRGTHVRRPHRLKKRYESAVCSKPLRRLPRQRPLRQAAVVPPDPPAQLDTLAAAPPPKPTRRYITMLAAPLLVCTAWVIALSRRSKET